MDLSNNLVYVVIGYLLVVGQVSAYFNQTYDVFSFILANVSTDNNQGKNALTYAQEWCRSNRYTLVTIYDKEFESYVNQFISSATRNGLMNTLDLIILNGRLYNSLPGTWMWANGQEKSGVNIQDERDFNQRYYYIYLKTSDYKLHASRHSIGRFFICEYTGSTNDCSDGLVLNGRCYRRFPTSMTWYSARNKCSEGGGDLASFETLTDNTFNSTLGSTLLANSSATEYWVGMQRVEWRWEDTGLAIKYTNWESGSPSNAYECLCLRLLPGMSEWLWFTNDVSASFRFICMTYETRSPKPSTAAQNTSPVKTVSGSVLSTPSSLSSSEQAAFTTSVLSQPCNDGFGQGVGVGVGIGLGVMVIVLVIIFVRQHLTKRRQNDAEREPNAVQESSLHHLPTISATAPTSDKSNKNSSATKKSHFGGNTVSTEDTYESLN